MGGEKTPEMYFVNKYGLIVLFYFKVARVILELIGIWFQLIPYFYSMIQRIAKDKLKDLASKFKAVAVTGARQTGKTTLVKQDAAGKLNFYCIRQDAS